MADSRRQKEVGASEGALTAAVSGSRSARRAGIGLGPRRVPLAQPAGPGHFLAHPRKGQEEGEQHRRQQEPRPTISWTGFRLHLFISCLRHAHSGEGGLWELRCQTPRFETGERRGIRMGPCAWFPIVGFCSHCSTAVGSDHDPNGVNCLCSKDRPLSRIARLAKGGASCCWEVGGIVRCRRPVSGQRLVPSIPLLPVTPWRKRSSPARKGAAMLAGRHDRF